MVSSTVLADHAPTQTPETQGMYTVTSVEVAGLATESEEIVWQMSSLELDNPPLSLPFLSYDTLHGIVVFNIPGVTDTTGGTGETQYIVSYSENTLADQGATNYFKQNDLDTRNQPANQENLETDKIVTFEGSATGSMSSSEDLLLDGASQFERTVGLFTCPFGSASRSVLPPYCNIVEMGSDVNIREGALVTSSGERSVAASADVPVDASYSIDLSGLGDSAASGSARAYMQSHLQEGRMILIYGIYPPIPGLSMEQFTEGQSLDLTYSEETSARGEITSFRKDMEYESGVRRAS